jgi:hypothetical protein
MDVLTCVSTRLGGATQGDNAKDGLPTGRSGLATSLPYSHVREGQAGSVTADELPGQAVVQVVLCSLSPLADRLCLALADRDGLEAWTADTVWGAEGNVRQIR